MGLRHLPIVDECNCIVGMITRSDLLKPIQLSPEAPSVMLVAPAATAVQLPYLTQYAELHWQSV